MHGEFCPYPRKGALTSHSKSRLIPHELIDGNARIDSNPDTVHARGVWSVSTREFIHELHMLHDVMFALRRERQHRLLSRHGAFTRDRSRSPVGQVLTRYDSTELDQNVVCGVGRKIRDASRSKWTRDEHFKQEKARLDLSHNTA